MVGLKRRRRVEGWAETVSTADEAMQSSFMQRIADSNKLWVATLVVLVVVAGVLMMQAKDRRSQKNEDLYSPSARLAEGSYIDKPHADFAADFVRKNGSVLDAHFGEGKFVIVVPGDASADDIEHLASMAAQRNLARFKNRIVVEVYQRSASTKAELLAATAKWEVKRYGFVVRWIRRGK
jgi:hypothetical protein